MQHPIVSLFLRMHWDVRYAWFYLALYFLPSAGCTYTTINTRQHQVVLKYPDQLRYRSERDLPICSGQGQVCTVLHKRWWLPPLAERHCRCPQNDECPWKWSDDDDNQTMFLNNRSQLKFCSIINEMKSCTPTTTAMTISTNYTNGEAKNAKINIHCHCSNENYWKFYKTTTNSNNMTDTSRYVNHFRCTPLERCLTDDFCGNVRIDQNSIYYRCSCPQNHLCVYRDKNHYKAEEPLYNGLVYKAVCEPIDSSYVDY